VFSLGDHHFGTLTALVQGKQAGQFGFTSSLTAQILKTLLPQLKPHLNLQPAAPPRVAADAAAEPLPAVVVPPRPRAPAQEKPDGSTSQADPPVKQPAPAQGGFPEDLEPSVVLPVPLMPEPALPAP